MRQSAALGTGIQGHPCLRNRGSGMSLSWVTRPHSPDNMVTLQALSPKPGTMDKHITPGELLCLGSSLAFSGLFYYLYRRKSRVVARIQVALSLRCSFSPTVSSLLPSML